MKKVFFVTLAMMLGVIAHAQVELKPAFGLTFADLSKDPDTGKAKAQAGYQVGASVLFGKKFYFDPGVFYVKKSTQFIDQGADTDDIKFNLTGLRVPVTVGYHLLGNEESIVDLRIMGGGSVFFVTNVDAMDAEKSDFTSPSWGVYAGAGIDIWILFLDVKYEWSLSDVSSVTSFDIGKHRSIYSNIGVRIRL